MNKFSCMFAGDSSTKLKAAIRVRLEQPIQWELQTIKLHHIRTNFPQFLWFTHNVLSLKTTTKFIELSLPDLDRRKARVTRSSIPDRITIPHHLNMFRIAFCPWILISIPAISSMMYLVIVNCRRRRIAAVQMRNRESGQICSSMDEDKSDTSRTPRSISIVVSENEETVVEIGSDSSTLQNDFAQNEKQPGRSPSGDYNRRRKTRVDVDGVSPSPSYSSSCLTTLSGYPDVLYLAQKCGVRENSQSPGHTFNYRGEMIPLITPVPSPTPPFDPFACDLFEATQPPVFQSGPSQSIEPLLVSRYSEFDQKIDASLTNVEPSTPGQTSVAHPASVLLQTSGGSRFSPQNVSASPFPIEAVQGGPAPQEDPLLVFSRSDQMWSSTTATYGSVTDRSILNDDGRTTADHEQAPNANGMVRSFYIDSSKRKKIFFTGISQLLIKTGADVELPPPQKLEWGGNCCRNSRSQSVRLALVWRSRATVTNKFCLVETERTTNVYLESYIIFIRNFVTELLLHFGDLLVTEFKTTARISQKQLGFRNGESQTVLVALLTVCESLQSKMVSQLDPLRCCKRFAFCFFLRTHFLIIFTSAIQVHYCLKIKR